VGNWVEGLVGNDGVREKKECFILAVGNYCFFIWLLGIWSDGKVQN
jgi:hypothetical protein